MGLDATVMCNCFRDGLATPPPFPLEWLAVDEDGCLNLIREHGCTDNWIKLDQWQQSCCQHEGMDFACKHISNWGGYRLFQAALEEIGWQHFPVLHEQLPNVNGGQTPPPASAQALDELKFFASRGAIGHKTVLVDTASGEAIHEHIAAYEGVFIFSDHKGVNVGLSEFELFAVNSATGDDLFRAARIKQFGKAGAKITDAGDNVVWQDLDTGTIYESKIAIRRYVPWEDGSWQKPDGRFRCEYPSELHIEQRVRHVEDFDDIVRALNTVFAASVTTGNPVRWC